MLYDNKYSNNKYLYNFYLSSIIIKNFNNNYGLFCIK